MPPPFHRQQYFIAAGLCLVFGVMYCFAPRDRADALLGLATAAAGFCFGKFSNGFRKVTVPPELLQDAPEQERVAPKGGG